MDNPVEPVDDPTQSFFTTSHLLLPDALPYTDPHSVYHNKLNHVRNLLVTSNIYGYTFMVSSVQHTSLYYVNTNYLLLYLKNQHAINAADGEKADVMLNNKILNTYELGEHNDVINDLVLSRDDSVLAVIRDTIVQFVYMHTLNSHTAPVNFTHATTILDLQFHPNTYGQFIVLDIDNAVTLYVLSGSRVDKLYTYNSANVYGIDWQSDEQIAMLSGDSIIQCDTMLKPLQYIDLITDEELIDFQPHYVHQLDADHYLVGYKELAEDNSLIDPLRVCMTVQNVRDESTTMLSDILNDESRLQADNKLYDARYINRLMPVKQWQMNLLSSNRCSELTVIGRTNDNEYRQYMVGDGSSIPTVPLDPSYADTYPVGVAIDTTNKVPHALKNGDYSNDTQSWPVLMILATDARVTVYSYVSEMIAADVMSTAKPLPSALPSADSVSKPMSPPTSIPDEPIQNDTPQANAFAAAQPKGGWNCEICEINNPDSVTVCRSCEAPKPGSEPITPAFGASSGGAFTFGSSQPITASPFSFGSSSADSKPTPFTFGQNNASNAPALPSFGFSQQATSSSFSFGNTNTAVKADTTSSDSINKTDVPTEPPTSTKPSFNAFAAVQPKGGWNCEVCDINNPDGVVQCRSCEAPKPGSKPIQSAIPVKSAFTFGVPAGNSAAPPSFSFGAPAIVNNTTTTAGSLESFAAPPSNATSAFSFGSQPPTSTATSAAQPSFKFGAPSEPPRSTSSSNPFTFGKPDEAKSEPKDAPSTQTKPLQSDKQAITSQPSVTQPKASTTQLLPAAQQAVNKDKQLVAGLKPSRPVSVQPSDFDADEKPDETEMQFRLALKQTAMEIEHLSLLRTTSLKALQLSVDGSSDSSDTPSLDVRHMHTLLLHTSTLLEKCKHLQDELYSQNESIERRLQSLTASIAHSLHDAEYSRTLIQQQARSTAVTKHSLDPASSRLHKRMLATAKVLNEQIQLLESYTRNVHGALIDNELAVQQNDIHQLDDLFSSINQHAQQLKRVKQTLQRIRSELQDTPLLTITASERLMLGSGEDDSVSFDDAELVEANDAEDSNQHTAVAAKQPVKQSLLSVDAARQLAEAFGNKFTIEQPQHDSYQSARQLLSDIDSAESERTSLPVLKFNDIKSATPSSKNWQRTSQRNKFTSPSAVVSVKSPAKTPITTQQSTRKFAAPAADTDSTTSTNKSLQSPEINVSKFNLASASKQPANLLANKAPTVTKFASAAAKAEPAKPAAQPASTNKPTSTSANNVAAPFSFGSPATDKPQDSKPAATSFSFAPADESKSDMKQLSSSFSPPTTGAQAAADKAEPSTSTSKPAAAFTFTAKDDDSKNNASADTSTAKATTAPSTSAVGFGDSKPSDSKPSASTFSFGSSSASPPSFGFPPLDAIKTAAEKKVDNKTEPSKDTVSTFPATAAAAPSFTSPPSASQAPPAAASQPTTSNATNITESKSSSSELGGFGGLSFGASSISNDDSKPSPFAFSFGDSKPANNAATPFGSASQTQAPAQPPPANPFGSIFGSAKAAPQPSAQATAFGSAAQQPSFGSSAFGQTASQPSFGSSSGAFGAAASAQPAFGQQSAFGAQPQGQPQQSAGFATFGASKTLGLTGFGAQQSFGTPAWGQPAQPSQQQQQQQTPTKTFGSSFVQPQTTSPFAALAQQAPASGFAAFGQQQQPQQHQQQQQPSPFAQAAQPSGSGWGSGFGATPSFGSTNNSFGNIRM